MDIAQLSVSCGIPAETLREYDAYGIFVDTNEDVAQENIRRLGILDTLLKAGFTLREAGRFFHREDGTARIYMLRDRRRNLLDRIHEQQRILDCIDALIWKEQKGAV